MAEESKALVWDQTGQRKYETGVDRGCLALQDETGNYLPPVAWNGLTKVTESPEGGEETALYADNIKYLSLYSAELLKGTIEAYTYPDEFMACDGSATVAPGVVVYQQDRKAFGLAYVTTVGNDVVGNSYGEKIHIVYGVRVSPSERSYETINDSPAAVTFSWAFSSTPIDMGNGFKPSSLITIDSVTAPKAQITALKELLFGSAAAAPKFPTPTEVFDLMKEP